jgi:hypothetical protein
MTQREGELKEFDGFFFIMIKGKSHEFHSIVLLISIHVRV